MIINYYYQFNDISKNKIFDDIDPDIESNLKDICKNNIKITYINDAKISPLVFNRSWKTFITDVNNVINNSKKYGVQEYFDKTIEYHMDSKDIIPTRFPFPNDNNDETGFIRPFLMTLPYLYFDIQNFGKFSMPFLMAPIYDTEEKLKLYQITGVSRGLLGHLYFPEIRIDYVISDKIGGKSRGDITFDTIDDLCCHIQKKSNIKYDHIDVIIGKLKDLYYIEGIEFNKDNLNFYDKVLSEDIVWKKMYELIVESDPKEKEDYLNLLNRIISETQSLIS